MLVVDYGKVYGADGVPCGFLYEDGFLINTTGPLGNSQNVRPIEDIDGCVFRGIDSGGIELDLPGVRLGPSGNLSYNGKAMLVVNGRIATQDHKLVGEFDDDGNFYVRDYVHRIARRKLDENTQLHTTFDGRKSDGSPWKHEFTRPLYRKDKGYSDNEIIRYFEEFDKLNTAQKQYVCDSMRMWSSCGLLQVVRKSEGTAMLGNVKHGAAGVTGVRTGYVTLDKEEFEKEITLFKRFGPLAVISTRFKPFVEVRINLVVAHEFGHQLEFVLSQASQEKITELYEQHKRRCDKLHPLPPEYDGGSEVLPPQQVHERVFISGYARSSMHEYWAECAAAFSVKESRQLLKEMDPGIYEILRDVILNPDKMVRPVFHDTILDLQSSLRVGGELMDGILD